jgi:membrane-associated phospholipid phosphatase
VPSRADLDIRNQRDLEIRVATNGVAAWLAAKLVKRIVGRARPAEASPSVGTLRIGSADDGFGFPSGHAAVATALARDLSRHGSTEVKVFVCGLACLVGASRIYVGAHYPLDIIGGWALGWFVGDVHTIIADIVSP